MLLALLAVALFLDLHPRPVTGKSDVSEYSVKAAFLLNFAKFTEWRAAAFADPDEPIRLCVVGDDPFRSLLDQTVKGEAVNGRALRIERFPKGADPARGCHMLFVSRSERDRLPRILGPVRSSTVLTISDIPGFCAAGGIIEFVLDERKVRFYVNLEAAHSAGLKLSSRLLKVARDVK